MLAFNIQAADGSLLIPASTFVNDDPNSWQPPSTSASDIAAGQTLWHTAALTIPLASGGTKPILAHCSDCHAQDGRDLKYFNYSNNSIQARSLFHGLTAQQGDQIASYIRTLNVVNPGRPWNPPYQPGPGLDSQPVSNWAAGAGLDAVLDTDQDMLNAMFPSGFQTSVFARYLASQPARASSAGATAGLEPVAARNPSHGCIRLRIYEQRLQHHLSNSEFQSPGKQSGRVCSAGGELSTPGSTPFTDLYNQVGTPIWNNPTTGWTPANVDAMYSLAAVGIGEELGAEQPVSARRILPKAFLARKPIRAPGIATCPSLCPRMS